MSGLTHGQLRAFAQSNPDRYRELFPDDPWGYAPTAAPVVAEAPQAESKQGWFGDLVDTIQGSFIRSFGNDADFVGTVSGSDSALGAADWLYNRADNAESTLSADAREARGMSLSEGLGDADWWGNLIGQGIGTLGAILATGGGATKLVGMGGQRIAKALAQRGVKERAEQYAAQGLGKEAIEAKIKAEVNQVNKLLRDKMAGAENAIGYGAAGAGIMGGSSASETRDLFDNATLEQLQGVEGFNETLARIQQAQPGLSEEEQLDLARYMTSRDEAKRNAWLGAGVGALTTPLTGMLARGAVSGTLGSTIKGAAAKGAGIEAGQEAVQEGLQGAIVNETAGRTVDLGRHITEGLGERAITGAIGGAIVGGPLGAIGGRSTPEQDEFRRKDEELRKSVSLMGAPKDLLDVATQRSALFANQIGARSDLDVVRSAQAVEGDTNFDANLSTLGVLQNVEGETDKLAGLVGGVNRSIAKMRAKGFEGRDLTREDLKLANVDSPVAQVWNDIGKMLGREIVVFSGGKGGFEGAFVPGVGNDRRLYINADADRPAVALAMHEAVHSIAETDPDLYRKIARVTASNTDMGRLGQSAKDRDRQELGTRQRLEELTADLSGDLSETKGYMAELQKRLDRSDFRKMLDTVISFVDRTRGAIETSAFGSEKYVDDLNQVREAMLSFHEGAARKEELRRIDATGGRQGPVPTSGIDVNDDPPESINLQEQVDPDLAQARARVEAARKTAAPAADTTSNTEAEARRREMVSRRTRLKELIAAETDPDVRSELETTLKRVNATIARGIPKPGDYPQATGIDVGEVDEIIEMTSPKALEYKPDPIPVDSAGRAGRRDPRADEPPARVIGRAPLERAIQAAEEAAPEAASSSVGAPKTPPNPRRERALARVRAMQTPDESRDDLATFIRKAGGLDTQLENDWAGRLRQLNKLNRTPGLRGIEQKGRGLTMDDLVELAQERGYLAPDQDKADLEELMFRMEGGERIYSRRRRDEDIAAELDAMRPEESDLTEDGPDGFGPISTRAPEFEPEALDDALDQTQSDTPEVRALADLMAQVDAIDSDAADALANRYADDAQLLVALEEYLNGSETTVERAEGPTRDPAGEADPGFALDGYTETDIAQREQAQAQRETDRVEAERRADIARRSEAEADSFTLTGSTSERDQAAAAGQADMLGAFDEALFSKSAIKSPEANVKRGQKAMTKALLTKSSQRRAMFRSGMGWIDFEWGDDGGTPKANGKLTKGKGIQHILTRRMEQDGMSRGEAVRFLNQAVPETIARGAEDRRDEYNNVVKIELVRGQSRATLVKRKGANGWLLTAFEDDASGATNTASDETRATQTALTLNPDDLGADARVNDASAEPARSRDAAFSKAQKARAKKTDAEYMQAVQDGDMEKAQKIVDFAARQAGYVTDDDYRMSHRAPNSEDDISVANIRESGLVPDDYWTRPDWYVASPEESESHSALRSAFNRLDAKKDKGRAAELVGMPVYRSVPKSVKDSEIRNGDWVTPSREYAAMEGASIPEGYRIISKRALLKHLWWDGNSAAELGYDDGKKYAYRNTKNNRKLVDAITRDDDGNIIPPSKRFNARSDDVRFSKATRQRLDAIDDQLLDEPPGQRRDALLKRKQNLENLLYARQPRAVREEEDREGGALFSKRQPTSPLPEAIIANPLGAAAGPDHDAAKAGDVPAAVRLARQLITPSLVQAVQRMADPDALIVSVASEESSGFNALPNAAGAVLATETGLQLDREILQVERVRRGQSDGIDRLFKSPEFDGEVIPGQTYVLLDDTLTQGGTIAALASHIEQNGGIVDAVVALTGKNYSRTLAPKAETLRAVRDLHGEVENDFKAATGYGYEGLTESEARYLGNPRHADAFRDRLAAEAEERADSAGVRDSEPGISPETDSVDPAQSGVFNARVPTAEAGKFKTGEPVTFRFVHNTSSATKQLGIPKKDSPYGRGFEPSGRYMVESDLDVSSRPEMVSGEITFTNPLVIPNDDLNWKRTLSEAYDGKTGKELSKALIADGYDGVVTTERGHTSEILDLTTFDESVAKYSKAAAAPFFGQVTDSPLGEEATSERWKRKFVDNMSRLKSAQEWLKKHGLAITDDNDAHTTETLFYGRTDAEFKKLDKERVRPLMNVVGLAEKSGLSVEQIDEYLIALHAEERNRQVRKINPNNDAGSGMTDREAQAIKSAYSGGQKQLLDRVAQQVRAINDEALQRRVDSGVLDADAAEKMRATYQNYVPLETVNFDPEGQGIGMGYDVRGEEMKRAMGRTSRATSPLMVTVLNAQRSIVRAQKAEVGRAVKRLAEGEANLQIGDEKIFEVVGVHDLRKSKIKRKIMLMDDAPADWKQRSNPKTFMRDNEMYVSYDEVTSVPDPNALRNTFAVKEDGKVTFIQVNDDILFEQLKKMGARDINPVLEGVGKVTRLMSRMYTQFNPSFTMVNGIRDAITGAINSLAYDDISTPKTVFGIPRAWVGIVSHMTGEGKGEYAQAYKEFLENGGGTGHYGLDTLRDLTARMTRDVRINPKTGKGLGAWGQVQNRSLKAWETVLDTVGNVNSVVEDATRLAFYKQARDAGYTAKRAAVMAKELTVNFNKKGEYGQSLNAYFMFFNAAVQGNRALYEHVKKSPKARNALIGVGMLGVAAHILQALAGDDEETGEPHWNKLSDWEQDHSVSILTNEDGGAVKIPLPYGYNVAYVIGRRVAQMLDGSNPDDIEDRVQKGLMGIVGATIDSFSPVGGPADNRTFMEQALRMIVPSPGQVVVDTVQNKDRYGKPIRREADWDQANTPDSEKFYRSVSPTALAIARLMNEATGGSKTKSGFIDINPEDLDHWYRTFSGGLGTDIRNTLEIIAGESGLDRAPIVRSVYRKENDYHIQSRFFEVREKMEVLDGRLRDQDPNMTREERNLAIAYRNRSKQLSKLGRNRNKRLDAGLPTDKIDAEIERLRAALIRLHNEFGGG